MAEGISDQQFPTSSLPMTSEDFKKRRSLRREGSLDTDSLKVPEFTPRPRSASLHVSSIRRSLRGLSRARPSSAKSGRAKLHGDVLGREVSTQEVDNAFARIKQQLAQFSEEDQVLKDRLDKLTEEIDDLRNAHKAMRLRYKRSSSERPNSPKHLEQQETIIASASEANLVPLNLDSKHQLQSEMELHTNCDSESQVIFLRVSESENNLVQLTSGGQYHNMMTLESDHTQTKTGTESPIPTVVISESESSQTGTESPIPLVVLESEDSQTGSQSPIPTTINFESETSSQLQRDTETECPEFGPRKKSELTAVKFPLPTVITRTSASHDGDPEQQIQMESGTDPGSIPTQFTSESPREDNGSLPESKEHHTLSATYYISCGAHMSGSISSDASFQSFVEQEHSPLSETEDVFFGD